MITTVEIIESGCNCRAYSRRDARICRMHLKAALGKYYDVV